MIDVKVSVRGRGAEQSGAENFTFKTAKDLEEWIITNHVAIAREIRDEFQARDEFPKKEYITLTDGVIDNPERNVKAFGKIEYATKIQDIVPVIRAAMRLVIERSPTKTGYYQTNNVLFFNGVLVAKGYFQTESWLSKDRTYKNTDNFRIVNLSPYARKLEVLGFRRGSSGENNGRTYQKGKREGINKQKRKNISSKRCLYIISKGFEIQVSPT